MSKITRKTATIFGGTASAAPLGIAQFGSLAAGSPAYSLDPAVIQALSNWLGGWNSATLGPNSPAIEDQNAVDYVNSYQLAYLLQQGIPEYDSGTTYYQNGFCSYQGTIYISLQNSNIGNTPSSSGTYWSPYGTGSKGENLIRNGSMAVAQRGASGTITASTPAYTLDGFIVDSVGANTAWSQTLVGNQNTLKLIPAGTLTDLYVKQRIESIQIQTVGYTNCTFQAQITNNTGSTITPTIALNVPTAQDNYASVTSVLAATNLQSITNGSTAVVSYTFAVSNAYTFQYGLEVILDFAASVGSGTNVEITNFDVSPTPLYSTGLNNNPPAYKSRFIAQELVNCQRYYLTYGGDSVDETILWGTESGTDNNFLQLQFPVKMRTIPTLTYSALTDFLLTGSSANVEPSAIVLSSANNSSRCCSVEVTTGSGVGSGGFCILIANATLSTRLNFSAEL